MTEFEYMILWPAVSSILAVILTIAGCIWARTMYWRDQEKKRIMRLGRALDRYISMNRDEFLDEDNIPEWFEKYKNIKLDVEVGK